MNLKNVVWTAVIATVLGFASLVSAVVGSELLTLAFGLTSIASATLSARERR